MCPAGITAPGRHKLRRHLLIQFWCHTSLRLRARAGQSVVFHGDLMDVRVDGDDVRLKIFAKSDAGHRLDEIRHLVHTHEQNTIGNLATNPNKLQQFFSGVRRRHLPERS